MKLKVRSFVVSDPSFSRHPKTFAQDHLISSLDFRVDLPTKMTTFENWSNHFGEVSNYTKSTLPQWRLQMRSKMFKTASLIVITYILCWLPYNLLTLLRLFGIVPDVVNQYADMFDLLHRAVLLVVVLNPFLYDFGSIAGWLSKVCFEISHHHPNTEVNNVCS